MTVGEKIRKYRRQKGLSQKDLAAASDMSEPAIRNYELGNRNPGRDQLEKISAALGISVYAISDPDLGSEDGAMHALYTLEDSYEFRIKKEGSKVSLVCEDTIFNDHLSDWGDAYNDYTSGKISEEEYDEWQAVYSVKPKSKPHK